MDAGIGWLSRKEKFRRRRLVIEATVRDARRQRLGNDSEGIRAFLAKEITASGEPLPADWIMETLIDRVRADDTFSHARTSATALARLTREAAERRQGIASAMRAAGSDTEPAELMVVEPDKTEPLINVALTVTPGPPRSLTRTRSHILSGKRRWYSLVRSRKKAGREFRQAWAAIPSPIE